MRDAATVVMRLTTEVRHDTVWVGPHVVQLGPEWLPGGMPHRIDPGYFKPVSHMVQLAVLADGTRIPARSAMPGWSAGTQGLPPVSGRQSASTVAVPAVAQPIAGPQPTGRSDRAELRSDSQSYPTLERAALVGAVLTCLGIGLSADVAVQARSALRYYDNSRYDTELALALESLLLGWLAAAVATAIRRQNAYRAAVATYRKRQRSYKQAAKEASNYQSRRASVIDALADLDADGT